MTTSVKLNSPGNRTVLGSLERNENEERSGVDKDYSVFRNRTIVDNPSDMDITKPGGIPTYSQGFKPVQVESDKSCEEFVF